MARRRRVYITRGVYSSTPFTGYTLVAKASEKERAELGPGDVARGLVYSRASDDNVHAALNLSLSLLPPSSREPARGGSLFSPFFFTFALYHIPFLPSYVPECRVAMRSAFFAFSFSSPSSVSIFYFFSRPFALTLYALLFPLGGEKVHV